MVLGAFVEGHADLTDEAGRRRIAGPGYLPGRARSGRPSDRWRPRPSIWKALREVYGTTREQRRWVHKTANVVNQLPKSVQPRAKQHLQDIWMGRDQGLPRPQDGNDHDLQAVPVGQQEVATPEWLAPNRRDRPRRQIQGRRKANRTRRLKPASPIFDDSSSWTSTRGLGTIFLPSSD